MRYRAVSLLWIVTVAGLARAAKFLQEDNMMAVNGEVKALGTKEQDEVQTAQSPPAPGRPDGRELAEGAEQSLETAGEDNNEGAGNSREDETVETADESKNEVISADDEKGEVMSDESESEIAEMEKELDSFSDSELTGEDSILSEAEKEATAEELDESEELETEENGEDDASMEENTGKESLWRRRFVIYRDCAHAYERGMRRNGVYHIRPRRRSRILRVYCNMRKDGGWTVFQWRRDGSVNFYRRWNEYVGGFGNLKRGYFLGLRTLRRLTRGTNSQLRVILQDWDGSVAFARYRNFGIGSGASQYTLSVSGYRGNAGDSLSYHNQMKFSTFDRDNDRSSANCAQYFRGAWWYNDCYFSNLNGVYRGTKRNRGRYSRNYGNGIEWYHWKRWGRSYKRTIMMVRRII